MLVALAPTTKMEKTNRATMHKVLHVAIFLSFLGVNIFLARDKYMEAIERVFCDFETCGFDE